MSFTVESKSQLAKLLATENLTIEHQKISTARFDPKNRVLYCPIWKDMSGSLYDLLMGHEVGHALYTPAEGWHDAVSGRGANFKGFLNVVEDARIEKKIKRKYPGIRVSFVKAYKELIDRDFFGLNGRDINTLSFIDRLNIFFKVGSIVDVQFSAEEMSLVKEVESCETWEDVLSVSKAVFEYSKEEQFETLQLLIEQQLIYSNKDENDEYDYDTNYDDNEYGDDSESTDSGNTDSDSNEVEGTGKSESSAEEFEDEYDYDDKPNGELNRFKDSQESHKSNFEPTCETDKNFRQQETKLLDEQCKPYVYLKTPKPILEEIVTPAIIVHKYLSDYYENTGEFTKNKIEREVKSFRNKNERYIGLLAKEFEMKKAARSYAKAKIATTGDIDIGRLYRYKLDDAIFRKTMRVPKGKSHGLVLLLDRSGSMHQNMEGSIEQILVLSLFCRKVNIPFVVYGFGDSTYGRRLDYPNKQIGRCFSENENEIRFSNVYLREYLNSRMGNAEFSRCIKNLIALKLSYSNHRLGQPLNEDLSNTPLMQAMVALEPITQEFRKVNNLDLVNLVIVHDGDSDNINSYVRTEEGEKSWGYFSPRDNNVILKGKNKTEVKMQSFPHSYYNYDDGTRVGIYDWFKKQTGAKIFGFFLAGENSRMREAVTLKYINKNGESVQDVVRKQLGINNTVRHFDFRKSDYTKEICAKIRSEKFIQSYNKGYESFFILPGGSNLAIQKDELIIEGNVTAGKLKSAFMKMNKKKQVNRVMVSRFIDGIAS
jgi:hypothetical protein